MENSKQIELFPDIKENSRKGFSELVTRRESRSIQKTPRYKQVTLPGWIKENRNRDTPSNL